VMSGDGVIVSGRRSRPDSSKANSSAGIASASGHRTGSAESRR
jgi:hypothetical protein